jgi:type I restriction enzyme, S subunit
MTSKQIQPWNQTTLGEVLPIRYGKARTDKAGVIREDSPVYGSSGVIDKFGRALTNGPALIIGRKGTVGASYYSSEPCWPIDTVYFTEASEGKDLRFFKYLLDHLQLDRMDRSTAVPGLSRDDYNAKKVSIPYIDEQRRIVAEIEKQFTRLEAGVAALRRVQANLKRYRAGVLKAAYDGSWPTKTLKDCFKVSRGRFGHRPRNEPRFYNGPFPFVQIGNLPRNGGSIRNYTQTLNEAGLAISRLFPAGTVLIAIVGATIGNTGILGFDSCAPDSLVALEADDPTLCKFAEYYLQSKKLAIRSTSYASGGQPNINLKFLSDYPFPLLPPADQTRIVEEVERRLSVVEKLETSILAELRRAGRLRQAILSGAFEEKNYENKQDQDLSLQEG